MAKRLGHCGRAVLEGRKVKAVSTSVSTGLLMLGALSGSTFAQERALEEIVVTAERREATIRDVPLTVQALPGGDLQARGVRDLKAALSLIPGASLSGETSAGTQAFQLRGVSTGDTTGDATVGAYIDDFAFSIPGVPFAPPNDLYDVARLEVLKGPQGTLWGSNSLGGVMKIVTNDPVLNQFELSAAASMATVKGHGYDLTGDVMVNLPLVEDQLALRAVLSTKKLSGWGEVPALNIRDGNDNQTLLGRVKLLYQPTDRLSLIASYWRFDEDQDFTNRMDGNDPPMIADIGVGSSPTNFDLYSATATYDFDFATLTSTWGYMDRKNTLEALGEQIDTFFDANIVTNTDSFVQENRLVSSTEGPLGWIFGTFYQDGKSSSEQVFDLTGKGANPDLLIDGISTLKSEEIAAYAEVSYELMEGRLRPLVGMRYSRVKRELIQDETVTINPPDIVIESFDTVSGTETHFNPRFNLAYFPNDDGMFFANVAQGFRPGALQTGANVAALQAITGVQTEIQQEIDTLWSYELGTKWRLLDGSMNVGLSLYYVDWEDAQFQTGLSGVAGIINLGDVEGRGVELELNHRTPIPGLSWHLAAGWNRTEIKGISEQVTEGLPFLRNGDQVPNVPKRNASLALNYERPTGFHDLELVSEFRYDYRSRTSDLATGLQSGQLDIFSMYVGFERDAYRVLLFADNLTNERGPTIWQQGRMMIPRPQTVGLRVMFTPNF